MTSTLKIMYWLCFRSKTNFFYFVSVKKKMKALSVQNISSISSFRLCCSFCRIIMYSMHQFPCRILPSREITRLIILYDHIRDRCIPSCANFHKLRISSISSITTITTQNTPISRSSIGLSQLKSTVDRHHPLNTHIRITILG